MLRMLSKLAHHPSSGGAPRARTDPTIRDVMRRLVDDWSLDDPNPEAYRQALEDWGRRMAAYGESFVQHALPGVCGGNEGTGRIRFDQWHRHGM